MNVLLFLLSYLWMPSLWAFKLSLLQTEINLEEGMTSTTATIINDSDNMIAIEAVARVRKYSQEGEENFDEIAENLLMIPSQMIIPANSEQILNIRWTGSPDIANEQAYRLLIEYISISEEKLKGNSPQEQKAGININYRIAKSFYVVPSGAKADVILHKVEKRIIDNQEKLMLSFENQGTKHQLASTLKLEVQTGPNTTIHVSIPKEVLGGNINFLAKNKRDVLIPCPEELKNQQILGVKVLSFVQ